jgi:hypothetical protein
MWPILPAVLHHDFGILLSNDFIDHFSEEANHAVFRDVARTNHPRGFDKRFRGWIKLKDGRCH